MAAYYNEIDPYAAQWLRNLMDQGHIAPGDVDERSIEDVRPSDLAGYTQCHFFAGIGVWSHALRQAGWPDNRPVWTGSCPCQPFAAPGSHQGFADERHLWPAFFHLIQVCRPDVVFGEQVADAIKHNWLDLVWTDLEHAGYRFGAFDLPAAGFGAPHIRQRLLWVGDAFGTGLEGHAGDGHEARDEAAFGPNASSSCPVGGFWQGAEWLEFNDQCKRPVQPGLGPMVDGAAFRVERLRAYGNAIVAPVASAFIQSYMDERNQHDTSSIKG